MRRHAILISLAALAAVVLPSVALAETRYAGGAGGTGTIQAAVNASASDDVIIVRDGVWKGDGNRGIDLHGKAITLLSQNGPGRCIIDCSGDFLPGFVFRTGERADSVVSGFTITGATGGAVVCDGGSPLIIGNRIVGNRGSAAVVCHNSSAIVFGNEIIANNGSAMGGGVSCVATGAIIAANLIACNSAPAGGGIECAGGGAAPFIVNNVIYGNTAEQDAGGGIGIVGAAPVVMCNTIMKNAAGVGGGIFAGGSGAIIANNVIAANEAAYGAGTCLVGTPTPAFLRNTVTKNVASRFGAGLCCVGTRGVVSNCIFWANEALKGNELALLAATGGSSLAISFSDVALGRRGVYAEKGCDLAWGAGMTDIDPLFAGAAKNDFHLLSKTGRPNIAAKAGWATDEQSSPCIDAGDPAAIFSHEPFPNGGRIDVGAYGNTFEASKSEPKHPAAGTDVTGDGKVTEADLEAIRANLNKNAEEGDNWKYDVNGDGKVNILDMIKIRNALAKEKGEQKKKEEEKKK